MAAPLPETERVLAEVQQAAPALPAELAHGRAEPDLAVYSGGPGIRFRASINPHFTSVGGCIIVPGGARDGYRSIVFGGIRWSIPRRPGPLGGRTGFVAEGAQSLADDGAGQHGDCSRLRAEGACTLAAARQESRRAHLRHRLRQASITTNVRTSMLSRGGASLACSAGGRRRAG